MSCKTEITESPLIASKNTKEKHARPKSKSPSPPKRFKEDGYDTHKKEQQTIEPIVNNRQEVQNGACELNDF
jgi:hypothetical protein